jgi:hypothetical protein
VQPSASRVFTAVKDKLLRSKVAGKLGKEVQQTSKESVQQGRFCRLGREVD